jgi:hypothetical protein
MSADFSDETRDIVRNALDGKFPKKKAETNKILTKSLL